MTRPPEGDQEYQSHYHMTPQMRKARALSQLNLLSRHAYASTHPQTIRQKPQPSPGDPLRLHATPGGYRGAAISACSSIADGYVYDFRTVWEIGVETVWRPCGDRAGSADRVQRFHPWKRQIDERDRDRRYAIAIYPIDAGARVAWLVISVPDVILGRTGTIVTRRKSSW